MTFLGPMYPAQDLSGAEQRLRDFLIGRFGGPHTYIEQRGHPRLRARHSPFPINQAARDRWLRLMNSAFGEAALPEEAGQVLRKFLDEMSTFMINHPEPGTRLRTTDGATGTEAFRSSICPLRARTSRHVCG
jgi:hemoglobin